MCPLRHLSKGLLCISSLMPYANCFSTNCITFLSCIKRAKAVCLFVRRSNCLQFYVLLKSHFLQYFVLDIFLHQFTRDLITCCSFSLNICCVFNLTGFIVFRIDTNCFCFDAKICVFGNQNNLLFGCFSLNAKQFKIRWSFLLELKRPVASSP